MINTPLAASARSTDRPRAVSRRKVAAAALALAGTAGLTALSAPPAAALVPDSYISGGANMRTCASTSCGAVAYLGNNTPVMMVCWWDGDYAVGNYGSNRWFRVGLHYDNRNGFVHSSLVRNQQPVGRCNTGRV